MSRSDFPVLAESPILFWDQARKTLPNEKTMSHNGSTKTPLSELRRLIDEADEAYYTRGQARVEDALYDQWKEELARSAPDDPRLKRVGAHVRQTHLQKRQHTVPMGSLSKATNLGSSRNG